jgi:hypothetical protein
LDLRGAAVAAVAFRPTASAVVVVVAAMAAVSGQMAGVAVVVLESASPRLARIFQLATFRAAVGVPGVISGLILQAAAAAVAAGREYIYP